MTSPSIPEIASTVDCKWHTDCALRTPETIAIPIAVLEQVRDALGPFTCTEFETPIVDEAGWTDFGISWCRERIVDWFGPTNFRSIRQAAASLAEYLP